MILKEKVKLTNNSLVLITKDNKIAQNQLSYFSPAKPQLISKASIGQVKKNEISCLDLKNINKNLSITTKNNDSSVMRKFLSEEF